MNIEADSLAWSIFLSQKPVFCFVPSFFSLKQVWYLKGLDDNGDLWGGFTWGSFLNLWSTCKNWEPSISTSTGFFRCDGRWVVGDFRFTEMMVEVVVFWVFFWCMILGEDGAISRNLKWLQENTTGIVTFCTWDQTPLGVNKDSRYPLPAIPSPSRNRTTVSTISRISFIGSFWWRKFWEIIQIFWIHFNIKLGDPQGREQQPFLQKKPTPSPRIGVQLGAACWTKDWGPIPTTWRCWFRTMWIHSPTASWMRKMFVKKTLEPAEKGVVLVGKTWRRGPATFKEFKDKAKGLKYD